MYPTFATHVVDERALARKALVLAGRCCQAPDRRHGQLAVMGREWERTNLSISLIILGGEHTMAALRSALRAAPRFVVRPSSVNVTSALAKRTYASPSRRPATDDKSLSEAEDASEDLEMSDPNMVCQSELQR